MRSNPPQQPAPPKSGSVRRQRDSMLFKRVLKRGQPVAVTLPALRCVTVQLAPDLTHAKRINSLTVRVEFQARRIPGQAAAVQETAYRGLDRRDNLLVIDPQTSAGQDCRPVRHQSRILRIIVCEIIEIIDISE